MTDARREVSIALAIVALSLVLLAAQPAYFSNQNLADLLLANLPVLIIALGMTLIILTGEIDISVGSEFAVCGVIAGLLAKAGIPTPLAVLSACLAGAALGSVNGALVAFMGIPSIVVTLASMVALRDALRWSTEGAWVDNLPANFQWLGLSQSTYSVAVVILTAGLAAGLAWILNNVKAGRAVIATGSNHEGARLIGIHTEWVKCSTFVITGTLVGLSAALNAVRFNQIPSNAGLGMEMKVIAAVVVGGASISGGRGTVAGAILGVVLLGMIGPALTFLGISAFWEKALQGAIILVAVLADALRVRSAAKTRTRVGRAVAA